MNIFKTNDYREIFTQVIKERRDLDPEISFQNMSAHMRVPKSYVSRVIHGKADLSPDQLFLACEYLGFTQKEHAYLVLLLELARTGLKRRKEQLLAQIRHLQAEHLDTKKHLKEAAIMDTNGDLQSYYFDPRVQLVHVCLTVPRYRKNLALLSEDLKLSTQQLLAILNKLEQMKIIARDNGDIKVLVENIHLPKSSPVYRPWRNGLKLMAMQKVDSIEDDDAYSFAVVFSSNEEAKRTIHRKFLEFIQEVEQISVSNKQENVYHLSFELFPWTKSPS